MNDTAPPGIHVRVSRRFRMSPDRVFDSWLRIDMLARWMFGPGVRDERIVHLQLEPRVGGVFSFRVERDGVDIEHGGRYIAIDRPHRLAFTWTAWTVGEPDAERDAGESLVEIAIADDVADDGDGCTLTLVHTMSSRWAEYADRTEQGWRHMLETLAVVGGNDAHGELTASDAIRFERLLPGPIERVWAHLVEPGKRRLWLADGPMTLAPGGELALHFRNAELSRDDDRAPEIYRAQENSGDVHGRILRCEPPHRLAFTWGDDPSRPGDVPSEVDIELREEGERVRLVLSHRRLLAHELTSVAGGWHTHLGILEDHLSGHAPRPFWRTHTRLEAEYMARLAQE